MNWEETIVYARSSDEYRQLITDAYLDADLKKNVEAFRSSGEFKETLELIGKYVNPSPGQKLRLLDIGAGNGISTLAFALAGFSVVAVEPDPSVTVGAGAIQLLKEAYRLPDIEVDTAYGEALKYTDCSFDVAYARQAMHHAHDLNGFISEAARVVKPGGIVVTCRDHVVNDPEQKEAFLKAHPFQKFYHGENAFSADEYRAAFTKAGLKIKEELGHLDSAINYSPQTKGQITADFKKSLARKMRLKAAGGAYLDNFIFNLFKWKTGNLYNYAGRLYTFVARKP